MAKYILFDTETTGNGAEDRIIQIGAMIVDSSGSVEVFDELCSSEMPIKIEAMEVHGITPEMLAGKKPCKESDFYARLNALNSEENFLIAHNLPFDLGMIEKEGFRSDMRHIDTLRCARHLFDDSPVHRLQYFRYALKLYRKETQEAEKYGIVVKAHDAIGDVLVMKLFLSELVAKVKERFADENVMQKLVELSKTPVTVKKFRFGKYKDRLVEEIVELDPGYIKWMLSSMEDLDADLRYTLEKLQER